MSPKQQNFFFLHISRDSTLKFNLPFNISHIEFFIWKTASIYVVSACEIIQKLLYSKEKEKKKKTGDKGKKKKKRIGKEKGGGRKKKKKGK